jgi:hypothetical protein
MVGLKVAKRISARFRSSRDFSKLCPHQSAGRIAGILVDIAGDFPCKLMETTMHFERAAAGAKANVHPVATNQVCAKAENKPPADTGR